MKNSFEKGPEGWCSYDYHASVVAGRNVFILTTWEPIGGVDDAGYVWTTHHRWSADTPEVPLSILSLIHYRGWIDEGPINLRDAELSVYLRGDDLELDGAHCRFWVLSDNTRWHLAGDPVDIVMGRWGDEPSRRALTADESRWHLSWSIDPANPKPLAATLESVDSYGFSFIGFSSEVHGKLSMAEFELTR